MDAISNVSTAFWEMVCPISIPISPNYIYANKGLADYEIAGTYLLRRVSDGARFFMVGLERPVTNPTIQIVRLEFFQVSYDIGVIFDGAPVTGGILLQENWQPLLLENDTFILREE
ncbi:MAG: hypothetical protein HC911_18010 [Chloroflexaceae bacterium]|nr:hypothetical protein [Chloroflexaceae bacterium]